MKGLDKGLITQLQAEHVEEHHGLAITYRLCNSAMPGTEFGQGKVLIFISGYIVRIFLQNRTTVFNCYAALFFYEMVGKIGC